MAESVLKASTAQKLSSFSTFFRTPVLTLVLKVYYDTAELECASEWKDRDEKKRSNAAVSLKIVPKYPSSFIRNAERRLL